MSSGWRDLRPEVPLLLSAGHVVAPPHHNNRGTPVLCPAASDAGASNGPTALGKLLWSDPYRDVGLVELSQNISYSNTSEAGTITQPRVPVAGETARKMGRTTCATAGVVSSAATLYTIGPCAVISSFVPDRSAPAVSLPGDSGSVWFAERDGAALGVHVRANDGAVGGEVYAIARLLIDITSELHLRVA